MRDADLAEILELPAEHQLRLVELLRESLKRHPAIPLDDVQAIA